VEFGVLGAIEVRRSPSGPPVDLGSPLQRVFLGLLLTEPDRPVSLDRIVDQLWREAVPTDPEASLHTYVSRLRRALEPGRSAGEAPRLLVRTPSGYRLAVPASAVDAGRFADLVARARTSRAGGDPAGALAAADEALALWRGPHAFEDAGDRDFAVRARDRLAELRLACREERMAALLELGRAAEAAADAEQLVREHPLRERPWELLIDALASAGRTAEALARYTEVHRLLDDELGITPGPGLRAAQARALAVGDAPPPAPARPPAWPAPSRENRPALVGREQERAALRELVEGLPRTGPRFVLLDGEPGIGKSRLAAEVTGEAAAAAARVAWGRCHEDDDAPALWPWHQVLTALTGSDPDPLAEPAEGTFAAFERVLTALVAASAQARVVVVLDDLQWADPASLRLLSFLAVELQHGPIAVLATCRSDVRDPAVARVRAALARTPGFTRLGLGPLAPGETVRLVRGVAGELDADTAADVHERSGGNPFFATELARMAADAVDGGVPSGARDVIDRRLSRLPEQTRALLRLAATAGQRFDVGLLQRASGTGDDDLLDALDAAQDAGLVRTAGAGRLAFAHALVRDSLLAELPELRRARLHTRLAAALPDSADPFERAHHLVAGRPFTDARATVDACLAAGARAARHHAHESAARWFQRALEALDADPTAEPPRLRQELLLQAGTSLAHSGSWSAARRLLTDAIGSALEHGDTETAATAADQFCGIGGLWLPVAYETYPAELVDRVEALLAATGEAPSAARVRALATLATVCHYGPDRERGPREADRALAAARRTGRDDLVLTALTARLTAMWLPGREQQSLDAVDELLRLAGPAGRPDLLVVGLTRRAVARAVLGDVDGHAEDLATAWSVAEEHELPLIRGQVISLQAARAMLEGAFDVALELIDRARAFNQRTQLYAQSWTDLVMRAFIWIDQGCLAERMAEVPTDLASQEGAGRDDALTAVALIQAGRPEAAAALMADRDGFAPLPMQWDWLSLTCWQAVIAADLAEASLLAPKISAAIADRLLPYADRLALHGGIGALGPVGTYLGRVEDAAGRPAEAERHLRAAVAVAERHGLRPSLARARLALAGMLARRGDEAAGRAEAAAARSAAEAVGMRLVATKAGRLAGS
jgi:DNA-binding SARP family transcriptional activator